MNKIIYQIIFLLLFLSVSPIQAMEPLSVDEIQELLLRGIVIDKSMNESEVIQKLGKPLSRRLQMAENPQGQRNDEVVELTYQDCNVILYNHKTSQSPWTGTVKIEVTSNKYELIHGLSIGMPRDVVEKLFSAAERKSWISSGDEYISFSTFDSVHEQIIFVIKDGIVVKIIWSDWP